MNLGVHSVDHLTCNLHLYFVRTAQKFQRIVVLELVGCSNEVLQEHYYEVVSRKIQTQHLNPNHNYQVSS